MYNIWFAAAYCGKKLSKWDISPAGWQKATAALWLGKEARKHCGCVWFYVTDYLQISSFDYSLAF